MKLRFHGNTLRLRLTQSDVARLAETGRVSENVTFASGQTLGYAIESGAGNRIAATFENGAIRVYLPLDQAKRWIKSDETGIEDVNGPLRILVEKDFQCLHHDAEQSADAFPNPLADDR